MRQIGDAILDFSDYMLVFIMFQSSLLSMKTSSKSQFILILALVFFF